MSQEDEARALSVQLEEAWLALDAMPPGRTRTLYLTPHRRITALGDRACIWIGCFTRSIGLAEFREHVFAAFEELKGRA